MRHSSRGDAAPIIEPPSREVRAAENRALLAEIRRAKRAVLVVNTKSRKGQQLHARAKQLLEERGYDVKASYPVRDPSRLPEIVEGLVTRGEPLVVVGGGDGTISSIVDFLAYRNVALGLLPLGTANSFARSLGSPVDVERAVDIIVSGTVADVDLGQVNDDLWANSTSIGISAAIGRARPHRLKRLLGRVGYIIAATPAFLRHKPFVCRLSHDGRTVEIEALDVLISNGPFHGGVLVAEEADVESRELVVRVIKGRSPWSPPVGMAAHHAPSQGPARPDRGHPCPRGVNRGNSLSIRFDRRRGGDAHADQGPRRARRAAGHGRSGFRGKELTLRRR